MSLEAKVIDYFDLRADSYLERSERGLWRVFRARESAAVLELLSPRKDLKILDVGCGAGFYSRLLSNDFHAEVTGIDISEKMIEQFKAQGMTGHVTNIEGFSCDDHFDRILAAGVLEFVEDAERFFKCCFGLLKEGGRLVTLVPHAGLAGVAYSLSHQARGCPTQVLKVEEYKKLAGYAGFKFVEQISCTPISVAMSWVR